MSIDISKPNLVNFGNVGIGQISDSKLITIGNLDTVPLLIVSATFNSKFYGKELSGSSYDQTLSINKTIDVPFKDGVRYYADINGKITTTVTGKFLGIGNSNGNLEVSILNDVYMQDNSSNYILDNSGEKIQTE